MRMSPTMPSASSAGCGMRTSKCMKSQGPAAAAAGAARETWEEALCDVSIEGHFAHLDLPAIGQAYVLFRAKPKGALSFGAGEETEEARFVGLEEIDNYDLAFTAVSVALAKFRADVDSGRFRVHTGTIAKAPGSRPDDMSAFTLEDYLAT